MEESIEKPRFMNIFKAIPFDLEVVYPGTDYEIMVPTEDSVRAVHDLVDNLYYNFTESGEVDLGKLEDVKKIISDKILINGQNKLLEWENLLEALKMHKFKYAYHHPYFWTYKKRLMFFGDVYSAFTGTDPSIAYNAVTDTNMFEDDWKVQLDDPHEAPLKRVFEKYGNVFGVQSFCII